MSTLHSAAIGFAALAFSILLGCGAKEPPRPFMPPLPPVATAAPPVELPEPPLIAALTVELDTLPWFVTPDAISAPEPPPPPPEPPKSKPAVVPEAPPPQPAVPQLAALLTDEQKRAYQDEYNQAMREVDAILGAVRNRVLTREQADIQERVRSFAEQARAERNADLATARNLASRARILAQELQRSLP